MYKRRRIHITQTFSRIFYLAAKREAFKNCLQRSEIDKSMLFIA